MTSSQQISGAATPRGKGGVNLIGAIVLGLKILLIISEIVSIFVMIGWLMDDFKKRPK